MQSPAEMTGPLTPVRGNSLLTVSVDDSVGTVRAIGNDITSLSWTMPSGVQDITGVNSSAMERLLLLADFTVQLQGVFNDAAAPSSFDCFKAYRTLAASQTGRTTTIVHSGQTLTNEVLYSDFSFNRGADGSLVWSAPGNLPSGVVPAWS